MIFNIRAIRLEDAAVYHSLVDEIKDEGQYLFSTLRFSLEDTKKYIERHEEMSSPIWGAFDEQGTLLGWIDFNRGGFSEIAHTATLGMGVKKEFRGQGIGSALMDACIENAESLGIEKLELEVFASNTAARALYIKKGFFEEGIRLKKRKFEDRYDDLVCMGLFLG
jgi:ribosomal protein S18 acetylase RimI-like enzyme